MNVDAIRSATAGLVTAVAVLLAAVTAETVVTPPEGQRGARTVDATVQAVVEGAEAAASGLVAVAGIVGVAALAYGAWQWVRSGRNYEGVMA